MTLFLPFETAPTSLAGLILQLDEDDGSRWYQQECNAAIFRELEEQRSTLIVMATGLGKTFVFTRVAHQWDKGPVLVLAHREELVEQAARALERVVGESVDIEKAQDQASFRSRYVVGSVQSVCQKKRLERMGHDRFSLIITDEAHHATASSYKRIYDWFGPAKHLGVTATPDRGDEAALGAVFDSVAYVFDIEQGIDDGFLVPVRGQHVAVADVSEVKSSKGDLAEGELDEAMLRAVAGVVHETLRLEPDRKGIFFWPGVRSSQLACETFNKLRPNSCIHIDANTPSDERKQLVADYRRGVYQYLMNVGIATEGFDCPDVSLVGHARPTKSRSLFAQMSGRGTRVLPGLVDHIRGKGMGAQRRAAIAASAKPDLMMLDFVKNAGRHDLVTPEDLLGGSYSEEEVALAKKKRGGGGDVKTELEKARAEIQRLADAARRRRVTSTVSNFDPFRSLGLDVSESNRYARFGKPVPDWLTEKLLRKGVPKEELGRLNSKSAFLLSKEMDRRHKSNLCTYKQAQWLERYGVVAKDVTFERATEALNYIFACRKRNDGVVAAELDNIINRQRESGED